MLDDKEWKKRAASAIVDKRLPIRPGDLVVFLNTHDIIDLFPGLVGTRIFIIAADHQSERTDVLDWQSPGDVGQSCFGFVTYATDSETYTHMTDLWLDWKLFETFWTVYRD
jgi:hypothetical protein